MTVDQLSGTREVDAAVDPDLANALGALAMHGEPDDSTPKLIEDPPDGSVTLPGGFLMPDGRLLREATVRELNGEDEEETARPSVANDVGRFTDTVLRRCVLTIGGEPATANMLDQLLIGDREMLLQAVRVATFGDTVRLSLTCPNCSEKFKVDYSFSGDVPVVQLDGHEVELDDGTMLTLRGDDHSYTIPLKRGRSAQVRLIDGETQKAVYKKENQNRTAAELNTLLLHQCIEYIDGMPPTMSEIRKLSTADRSRILAFLTDAQPGPNYGEVTHPCPACERELPLVLDVAHMFRGIG